MHSHTGMQTVVVIDSDDEGEPAIGPRKRRRDVVAAGQTKRSTRRQPARIADLTGPLLPGQASSTADWYGKKAQTPRAFAKPPNSYPLINDGLLWTTNSGQDLCTDWVFLGTLDLHATRDAVARIAAHVTRAVKRLLSQDSALLQRQTLRSVTIEFKGPWERGYAYAPARREMTVESIRYHFGGAMAITVRVLNSSDLPHGLPCQEAESLKAMQAAGGSSMCLIACASESMPLSPERVVYARRRCTTGVCRRVPTSNDWFNAGRFDLGDGSDPIDLDGVAVTNSPPTTGCQDEPLYVRNVLYADTSVPLSSFGQEPRQASILLSFSLGSTASVRLEIILLDCGICRFTRRLVHAAHDHEVRKRYSVPFSNLMSGPV